MGLIQQDKTLEDTSLPLSTIPEEKSPNSHHQAYIVRPRDLPAFTGLSRTTIWRLERAGLFVRRIRLSAGAVGYRMADIQAWLDSRQTVGE